MPFSLLKIQAEITEHEAVLYPDYILDAYPFHIYSDAIDNIQVRQCYKSFITVTEDSSQFVGLRSYKYYQSFWVTSVPIDNVYYFQKYASVDNYNFPFPSITSRELKSTVKKNTEHIWPEYPKKFQCPMVTAAK